MGRLDHPWSAERPGAVADDPSLRSGGVARVAQIQPQGFVCSTSCFEQQACDRQTAAGIVRPEVGSNASIAAALVASPG
jgi:hypothetical protein